MAGLPAPSWGSWLMEAGSLEGDFFEGGDHRSIVEAHSTRDTTDLGLSVGNVALPYLFTSNN